DPGAGAPGARRVGSLAGAPSLGSGAGRAARGRMGAVGGVARGLAAEAARPLGAARGRNQRRSADRALGATARGWDAAGRGGLSGPGSRPGAELPKPLSGPL